jgi:hypothetical protein
MRHAVHYKTEVSDPDLVYVTRWRRYGMDRLYVTRGDDVKVGWWDLKSAEAHPEAPEHMTLLMDAVKGWPTNQRPPMADALPSALPDVAKSVGLSTSSPIAASGPETSAPVARPWIDLVTNAAGEAAREQALAAKEAAPFKSFLARALGVHTDERAWRIGADGEEKVAAQLAKAAKKDPRWKFLHAIPVGNRGADIDHLVIGPGGVFTVNAKHHPNAKIWVGGETFMVNGNKQPYIRNSRHEATRASRLLTDACGVPVHVEALIVTVNAGDLAVKKAPSGVHVVPHVHLAKWLLRHGDIHTAQLIETVHAAARRSTTWAS